MRRLVSGRVSGSNRIRARSKASGQAWAPPARSAPILSVRASTGISWPASRNAPLRAGGVCLGRRATPRPSATWPRLAAMQAEHRGGNAATLLRRTEHLIKERLLQAADQDGKVTSPGLRGTAARPPGVPRQGDGRTGGPPVVRINLLQHPEGQAAIQVVIANWPPSRSAPALPSASSLRRAPPMTAPALTYARHMAMALVRAFAASCGYPDLDDWQAALLDDDRDTIALATVGQIPRPRPQVPAPRPLHPSLYALLVSAGQRQAAKSFAREGDVSAHRAAGRHHWSNVPNGARGQRRRIIRLRRCPAPCAATAPPHLLRREL